MLLALSLLAGGNVFGAPAEGRFSATLLPVQRTELGFDQLTVDNIASIDAQVRQDAATAKRRNNVIATTSFSQRRTDTERAAAGLDRLNAEQRKRLDGFVALRLAGAVAPVNINSAGGARSASPPAVQFVKPRPEIHGSASLTYGWSDAGSFRGADMVVTYDDPANRYSVLVGYSTFSGSGLPHCGVGGYGVGLEGRTRCR